MKIYTKTGDRGTTSLVGGQRVSKCCDRLESYGTIDELNSHIGMLITYCTEPADIRTLTLVQNNLFVVGGYLATDNSDDAKALSASKTCVVTDDMILYLEQEIDRLDKLLLPLRAFILPGGSRGAACSHICRTICRRAERDILRLQQTATVEDNVLAYINRLSDYLFILSRKLNQDSHTPDVEWQKPQNV